MKNINKCKIFINYIYVSITIVLWLSNVFVSSNQLIFGNVTIRWIYMGIITFLMLLSLFFNINYRKRYAISILDIILLIFLIWNLIKNESHGYFYFSIYIAILYFKYNIKLDKFQILFFVVTLFIVWIQCSYGVLQLLNIIKSNNKVFQITGTLDNPNAFACYLMIGVVISIYSKKILQSKKYFKIDNKKLYENLLEVINIGIYFILFFILISESRAAIISVAVVVLFIKRKYLLKKYGSFNYKQRFLLIITIIALFIFLIKYKYNSAIGRIIIWQTTIELIIKRPFLGYGQFTFEKFYPLQQLESLRMINNSNIDLLVGLPNNPFNLILDVAYTYGVTGLIAFLFIFYRIFKKKKSNTLKNSILFNCNQSIIIGIFVFSLFSYPLRVPSIVSIFLISFSYLISFENKIKFNFSKIKFLIKINNLIILFIFGISISNGVYKDITGSYYWNHVYSYYLSENYIYAEEFYKKANFYISNNGKFYQMFGKCLLNLSNYRQAIYFLKKADKLRTDPIIKMALAEAYKNINNINSAEKYFIEATEIIPYKLYPKYRLLKFYDSINDRVKTKHIALRILRQKIKIKSNATEEIIKQTKMIIRKIEKENKNL